MPCDFNFTKKYSSSGQIAISGELESLTTVSGEKCLGGLYAISGMTKSNSISGILCLQDMTTISCMMKLRF